MSDGPPVTGYIKVRGEPVEHAVIGEPEVRSIIGPCVLFSTTPKLGYCYPLWAIESVRRV